MTSRSGPLAVFTAFMAVMYVLCLAPRALALECRLKTQTLSHGAEVVFTVTHVGKVGAESDFSMSSLASIDITGSADFRVGKVTGGGVFVVKFIAESEPTNPFVCVVLIAKNGDKFEAAMGGATVGPMPEQPASVKKFLAALNADVLKAAAKPALEKWLGSNAVGVTATMTVCVIPGMGVTCVVRLGSHAVDITATVLAQAADDLRKAAKLTQAEFDSVKLYLSLGSAAVQIVINALPSVDRLISTLTEAASQTASFTIEHGTKKADVQVAAKTGQQFFEKTWMLLKIKPH